MVSGYSKYLYCQPGSGGGGGLELALNLHEAITITEKLKVHTRAEFILKIFSDLYWHQDLG